jgi:hypothetical protein
MKVPQRRRIEPMTVGELRNKIKTLPANMPVYMLTDLTLDNWDDDNERWREVHPLSYVEREKNLASDEYTNDEYNLILRVEEP